MNASGRCGDFWDKKEWEVSERVLLAQEMRLLLLQFEDQQRRRCNHEGFCQKNGQSNCRNVSFFWLVC